MEPNFFVNSSDDVYEDNHLCNESVSVSDTTSFNTTTYLLCVFVGSLSALIMCGNLLVIISIVYFKQLQTPTNFLVLSLAVADLLVGVIVLPFSTILSVSSSCWYLIDLLCKVRVSFDRFLVRTSILSLFFISLDRYYAVCQPLTYRARINVRVVAIMILLSWSISALSAVTITTSGLNKGQSKKKCVLVQNAKLAIEGIVTAFYLPALIICTIYLKILTVAQRQARSIHNTTCQNTKTVSKKERKATKTLAVVMGVFLLSWTPFFLCMTFKSLSNYTIPAAVIAAFKWLGWSNSMLNPFVYAFFYRQFRFAFRMIITGKIFQGNFTNSKLL